MRMNKFFIGIFLLIVVSVSAQINTNSNFTIISKTDGLISNFVNSIIQDDNGVMWFATEYGVSSFNGTEFTSYTPENSPIPHHRVFDFAKDSSGIIWAATGKGICKINPYFHTFKVYNIDNNYNELTNDYILNVEIDENNNLWFSNTTSICLLDESKDTIYSYPISEEIQYYIYKIETDDKNNIWLSANNELLKFNKITHEYSIFNVINKVSTSNNPTISSLKYGNGILWCSTIYGSLYKINPDDTCITEIQYPLDDPSSIINKMFIDNNILYILINKHGIYKYNITENKGEMLSNDLFSIVDNRTLTCIYKDIHNNFWLSIQGVGIAYATPFSKFNFYNSKTPVFNSLRSNNISSLFIYDNNILLGTDGGGIYMFSNNKLRELPTLSNEILSINWIKDNEIWIGTYTNGVFKCNYGEKITIKDHLTKANGAITSNDVRKTIIDNTGKLWFATHGSGVMSYDTKTKIRKSYSTLNGLSGDWPFDIVCDKNNTIWIATNNGLSCINNNGDVFTKEDHALLNNNYFLSLLLHKNKIWCGAKGGYIIYNVNTNAVEKITDEVSFSCNSMIDDQDGNIWIGTDNGLIKLNEDGDIIENFLGKSVFPSVSFRINSVEKDKEGKLYWGTTSGLLSFYPDSIKKNLYKPILSLKSINVNNVLLEQTPSVYKDSKQTYTLKNFEYNENSIAFSFNVINYLDSRENKISYRLIGLDTAKTIKKNTNSIHYKALPPGQYSLEVSAANCDNVWGDTPLIISFLIKPPFWETWWFRILVILSVILATLLFFLYKTRNIRIQKKLLSEEVAIRTKELTQTLHELEKEKKTVEFQNDELIELTNKLKENNIELEEANNTKSRLMSIIAHDLKNPMFAITSLLELILLRFNTFDESKKLKFITSAFESAKSIQKEFIKMLEWGTLQQREFSYSPQKSDIAVVINNIISLLKESAHKKSIEIKLTEQNDLFVFVDSQMISIALRNLLSNAIKFTPKAGVIYMSCQPEEENLIIKIRDTGVGMTKEQMQKLFDENEYATTSGTEKEKGTGLGMKIAHGFIQKNKGTITVESEIEKGTCFTISLPLYLNRYHNNELESSIIDKDSGNNFDIKHTLCKENNILIVDDNIGIREHLKNILSEYSTVLEAENGEEGIKTAIDLQPDIIISDVDMPIVDGFEMCEKIYKNEQIAHIPLILLTARTENIDKITGLSCGALDYLTKPFNESELLLKLSNLLQIRQKIQNKIVLQRLSGNESDAKIDPFLEKLISKIEQHYSDPEFTVEKLADMMGISRSTLIRRSKLLIDKNPSEVIIEYRLQTAMKILKNRNTNISDIAYRTGFNDPGYFSKKFKQYFKKAPSEFRN